MQRPDRETVFAWALFGAILVAGIARAATVAPIPSPPPAGDLDRHAVFNVLAEEERRMRRQAAKDFPADPWSQDDAFHNFEYKRARGLAGERGMPLEDVLRAADEGMHAHWPAPPGVWLNPSVPPCRPRPIH